MTPQQQKQRSKLEIDTFKERNMEKQKNLWSPAGSRTFNIESLESKNQEENSRQMMRLDQELSNNSTNLTGLTSSARLGASLSKSSQPQVTNSNNKELK